MTITNKVIRDRAANLADSQPLPSQILDEEWKSVIKYAYGNGYSDGHDACEEFMGGVKKDVEFKELEKKNEELRDKIQKLQIELDKLDPDVVFDEEVYEFDPNKPYSDRNKPYSDRLELLSVISGMRREKQIQHNRIQELQHVLDLAGGDLVRYGNLTGLSKEKVLQITGSQPRIEADRNENCLCGTVMYHEF